MSRVCTATWKPAERSVAVAVSWSRSVTSGTAVVEGPLETLRVTVDPLGAALFADGLWLTTVSAGSFDCTSWRLTAKPRLWSSANASL